MSKSKPRLDVQGSPAPLRQALPGLGALRDKLPAGEPPPPGEPTGVPAATAVRAATIYARAAKIVVRRERKGHAGKTATRIEGLAGSTRELEGALREVKRALGCGAALDGSDIVVQGAPGERLVAFLEGQGARKVVVGS